jgi:hypothetical protein
MQTLRANGSPGIAFFIETSEGVFTAAAIAVLAFRGGYVAQVTRFASPHLFRSFGCPSGSKPGKALDPSPGPAGRGASCLRLVRDYLMAFRNALPSGTPIPVTLS